VLLVELVERFLELGLGGSLGGRVREGEAQPFTPRVALGLQPVGVDLPGADIVGRFMDRRLEPRVAGAGLGRARLARGAAGWCRDLDLGVALLGLLGDLLVGFDLGLDRVLERLGLDLALGPDLAVADREGVALDDDLPEFV
jgi:hypothetical protein